MNDATCSYCGTGGLGTEIPRIPCPNCGATARTIHEHLHFAAKAGLHLFIKHKRPGYKRPLYEGGTRMSLSRARQKMVERGQVFDRERDLYVELITDPDTGEVMHHCRERLSDHLGHGSDKRRRHA